jgi:hypothetical protein
LTILVIDPSDGKIPPMTAEAQAKFEMARHPSDGPEGRNLSERCLMFSGVGPPMLPEPHNNDYQIVQAPGYVAIVAEMNHDVRTILTDGRPALPASVSQWHGDSRGRWEGDTLVVETTNVKFNKQSQFGVVYVGMTDENLRVTERFTLMAPNMILYRATIEDPTVYSRPWMIEETLTRAEGPIFEYACHEGNYGMVGILEGARAEERKAGGSR